MKWNDKEQKLIKQKTNMLKRKLIRPKIGALKRPIQLRKRNQYWYWERININNKNVSIRNNKRHD